MGFPYLSAIVFIPAIGSIVLLMRCPVAARV
jgi:hypothetical protein